jgi:hypothetical protein
MTWLICIKALWAIYNYIFLKRQGCLLKYDSMRCFVASNLTPSALNLIFKKYYIKGWNVIVKPLIFYYFLWISFCFLWMYLQVWRTWKDAILPVSNLERKGIKFTWYNYILKVYVLYISWFISIEQCWKYEKYSKWVDNLTSLKNLIE